MKQICISCGKEIDSEDKFCKFCGVSVSEIIVSENVENNKTEVKNTHSTEKFSGKVIYANFWKRAFDIKSKETFSSTGFPLIIHFAAFMVAMVFCFIIALVGSVTLKTVWFSLFGAIVFVVFIPSLTLTVRRFKTIGKTPLWSILYIVPVIGWIIVIGLLAGKD